MEFLHLGERPLPESVRLQMEALFAADFSQVKIYPESSLALMLGARACTSGDSVHFAPGEYQPDTAEGWSVIGHELTHVLQQRRGCASHPRENAVSLVNDPDLEWAAENAGECARLLHNGKYRPPRVRSDGGQANWDGRVVQCLMSLQEFRRATGIFAGGRGFRHNILDVEQKLDQFNRLDGSILVPLPSPVQYQQLLTAIRELLDACNKYQGSRSPGVATLISEILPLKRFLELMVGASGGIATERLDCLDKAKEFASTFNSLDWGRRKGQIDTMYRLLAPLQNIAGEIGRNDVQKLSKLALVPNMPITLKNVIGECVTAFQSASQFMQFEISRASMGLSDGAMLWRIRFDEGRVYRLGQALHELTHLSTALKFRWIIMLCLPVGADNGEIEDFAKRRYGELQSLEELVGSSGLPDNWLSLAKGQIKYASQATAFNGVLNGFKDQIGDSQYERFKKMIAEGKVHSELHEYDTVINQMALWCYLLGNKSAFYNRLLSLAEQAYTWRAKYNNGIGGVPKQGLVRRVFGR